MSAIELRAVTKTFPNGYDAVRGVDMAIADGEFMVLVGPSGCGKTTLLRMIAGLEEASGGAILIGDRDVVRQPPGERDIAMVFQSYALYPHMTVRKNLGYGLKVRGTDRAEVKRRVEEVARMLSLEDLLDRRPAALSGGQRQRVAMGRAIAREPAAYLMDEPLSNLDARLRVGMRAQLSQLHERLGVTTVYVTHDQVEAMTLGQRVAVMRGGTIQQVADPLTLYERPANVFVAAFIGSPPMNLVHARMADGRVAFGALSLPVPHRQTGRVVAGLRPEAFVDVAFAQPSWPTIDVEAVVVEQLGAETHVIFAIDAPSVAVDGLESGAAVSDDDALVEDTRTLLTARLDGRRRTVPGDIVRLAADPAALYLFDAETGVALAG